jgi:predicted nucleic acid-binding protein
VSRAVLLDSSALFAAADRRETHHRRAAAALDRIRNERLQPVTTDLIIAELHALALRRLGPRSAMALVDRTLDSAVLEVVPTATERFEAALDVLRSRPDRHYSLTDAVAFVLMRERGIEVAFTLDADYLAEGFAVMPE